MEEVVRINANILHTRLLSLFISSILHCFIPSPSYRFSLALSPPLYIASLLFSSLLDFWLPFGVLSKWCCCWRVVRPLSLPARSLAC